MKEIRHLVVIDLETRRVCIGGTTPNPDDAFMAQVARNLTDIVDGFLLSKRFLICDRDTKFSGRFRRLLSGAGVEVIRTPFRAPNARSENRYLPESTLRAGRAARGSDRSSRRYGSTLFHGKRPVDPVWFRQTVAGPATCKN